MSESPALERLGAEGWELVAIRGNEWVFKRPEPDLAERITREQRAAALRRDEERGTRDEEGAGSTLIPHPSSLIPEAPRLLNPAVAALIRQIHHTQMLLIADRGFPVPRLPVVIDLSLTADIPTIPQVLAVILPDLPADRIIVAEEQQALSPARWQAHVEGPLPVEAVPHLDFKRLARHAAGCIRTGDAAPYANVLVVGG